MGVQKVEAEHEQPSSALDLVKVPGLVEQSKKLFATSPKAYQVLKFLLDSCVLNDEVLPSVVEKDATLPHIIYFMNFFHALLVEKDRDEANKLLNSWTVFATMQSHSPQSFISFSLLFSFAKLRFYRHIGAFRELCNECNVFLTEQLPSCKSFATPMLLLCFESVFRDEFAQFLGDIYEIYEQYICLDALRNTSITAINGIADKAFQQEALALFEPATLAMRMSTLAPTQIAAQQSALNAEATAKLFNDESQAKLAHEILQTLQKPQQQKEAQDYIAKQWKLTLRANTLLPTASATDAPQFIEKVVKMVAIISKYESQHYAQHTSMLVSELFPHVSLYPGNVLEQPHVVLMDIQEDAIVGDVKLFSSKSPMEAFDFYQNVIQSCLNFASQFSDTNLYSYTTNLFEKYCAKPIDTIVTRLALHQDFLDFGASFEACESFNQLAMNNVMHLRQFQNNILKQGANVASSAIQAPPAIEPVKIADLYRISKRHKCTIIVQYTTLENDWVFSWIVTPSNPDTLFFEKSRCNRVTLEVVHFLDRLMLIPPEKANAALNLLHAVLIEPIQQYLPKDPEELIYFIPHAELGKVPYHALVDVNGSFLVERHTSVTHLSVRSIDYCDRLHDENLKRVSQAAHNNNSNKHKNEKLSSYSLVAAYPEFKNQQALPGTYKEFEEMLRIIVQSSKNVKKEHHNYLIEYMITDKVNKHNIVSYLEQVEPQVIHFSSHGQSNAFALPKNSAVRTRVFDNRGAIILSNDEQLHAKYIEQHLNLQGTELISLTTCKGADGAFSRSGSLGIKSSFLMAGVPSLIGCLWNVADASFPLIVEFYKNLFVKKMNKAAALRHATLSYRETLKSGSGAASAPSVPSIPSLYGSPAVQPDLSKHFAFWAIYALYGNEEAIQLHDVPLGEVEFNKFDKLYLNCRKTWAQVIQPETLESPAVPQSVKTASVFSSNAAKQHIKNQQHGKLDNGEEKEEPSPLPLFVKQKLKMDASPSPVFKKAKKLSSIFDESESKSKRREKKEIIERARRQREEAKLAKQSAAQPVQPVQQQAHVPVAHVEQPIQQAPLVNAQKDSPASQPIVNSTPVPAVTPSVVAVTPVISAPAPVDAVSNDTVIEVRFTLPQTGTNITHPFKSKDTILNLKQFAAPMCSVPVEKVGLNVPGFRQAFRDEDVLGIVFKNEKRIAVKITMK